MSVRPFTQLLVVSAIAMTITACGGGGGDPGTPPPAPPVVEAGDVFVLTASNKVLSFNRATPGTIRTTASVTGLQSGESLVGIDFRPADGQLYGLGSGGRIYTINGATGVATLKSTLSADPTDTSAPFTALNGAEFGVDFNPAADRLRVVSNTGQNLRINVDSGATSTDTAINGGAANAAVTAAGYTNSFAGAATTTLFVIDQVAGTLYTQNPPNNGTLSAPVALGVTASAVGGFDIDARTNTGYAVMTVGGARNLYTLNLAATSAAATLVGAVGVSEDLRGIALRTPSAPLVYGLTDDSRIVTFKAATPNTLDANVAITGLAGGERLVGFDIRPKDGMLYGLTSNARIVTIDPATGAATVKGTVTADATDTSSPFATLVGNAFAVDFNPAADRMRVVSNAGQNLRINVDTFAATTDTAISRTGARPVVTAAAYTNSFAGATSTVLFDIDSASASLTQQNPPNDGTLINVGALGVVAAGDGAMDIAGGANGLALAALRATPTGPSTLYRIDLSSGAATAIGAIAGATPVGLSDLAISLK